MKMKAGLFSDKEFNRKLWRLTLPIAFQSLMLAAVAAGDAVMLGRVEQNSMAAVSLATQIQFIQNMMISATVSVLTVLGAQYYGKGDEKTIRLVGSIALRLNGFISLLFFLGCIIIPEKLMMIYASDAELIRIGAAYLRIAGWSYLMTGVSQCFLGMMKITDHVKETAFISTLAVVLNIVLNAVFIFGLLGFPAMGARGAAVATVIARSIELLLAVGFSFRKGFLRPSLKGLVSFTPWLEKDFIKVFLPLIGASLLWTCGFSAYTAITGHLGTDAAAANSISAVVRDLMCCLCNGISAGGGIMVGNELGKGDLEKGRVYGDKLMSISYLTGFGATILILLITYPVARFMILSDNARSLLYGMMIITSFYMIGRCVNTVIINGVFAAGGDTMFDMYSLIPCMWCLAIPLAALGAFVFHWPVLVVYACCCLDEVGKIPWVMLHYRKYKWVKDLTNVNAEENKAN